MILIKRLIGTGVWILGAGVALVSASRGQEPAQAGRMDFAFPVTARPLTVEQPPTSPTPRLPEQRFPFRLVSAEAAPPNAGGQLPRKLAPRSVASREPPAKPAAFSPINSVGTVAASLGIVVGLFLILVWYSRRLAPAGAEPLAKEAFELLGRAALGGKHQAQLVRVGNKLLLVALFPTGAATLTEIIDPAEIERLTTLCRRGQPGSSTAAFRQVLDQIAQEPVAGGFVGVATANRRGGR